MTWLECWKQCYLSTKDSLFDSFQKNHFFAVIWLTHLFSIADTRPGRDDAFLFFSIET
jgi:hypothetical protein